jgi:hypothetical protein
MAMTAAVAADATERKALTEKLLRQLNQVVQNRRLSTAALCEAWIKNVNDAHDRQTLELDRRWVWDRQPNKYMGRITLLELVLHLALQEPDFFDTDAWCADLLHNLRTHRPFDDALNWAQEAQRTWPIVWRSSGLYEDESNMRHDIVHTCQSVLFQAATTRSNTKEGLALFAADVLEHLVTHGKGCSAEQINMCHLYTQIIGHRVLRTRILNRLLALVHTLALVHGLTQNEHGEGLIFHMLLHAPLAVLDHWIVVPEWVDTALHSDWFQPSRLTQRNIRQEIESSKHQVPYQGERLHRIAVFQTRWSTHILPNIEVALCLYLPRDLAHHLILPYLAPLPGLQVDSHVIVPNKNDACIVS